MYQFKLDGKDVLAEYNMICASFELSGLKRKASTVSIPGRDGELDLSDAYGGTFFESRSGTAVLGLDPKKDMGDALDKLENAIVGKRISIWWGKEPNHHWMGVCDEVNKRDTEGDICEVELSFVIDPKAISGKV